MARLDELRLMAKVARLYHGAGLRQTEITERLNIHQSTVSRLLKRAEKEGIVRITFSMPSGSASGARGRACSPPTACGKPSSSTRSMRKIRSCATWARPPPSIWRRR